MVKNLQCKPQKSKKKNHFPSRKLSFWQGTKTEEVETSRHFVLVRGGRFGAWCWYTTTRLLKDLGYQVDDIDLTGSGAHPHDSDSITTLTQYVKPLTYFLENLPHNRKVILIGHDIGGACISHAMELHKSKISKAVFVVAAMMKNEMSILDMFSQKVFGQLIWPGWCFSLGAKWSVNSGLPCITFTNSAHKTSDNTTIMFASNSTIDVMSDPTAVSFTIANPSFSGNSKHPDSISTTRNAYSKFSASPVSSPSMYDTCSIMES